MLPVTQVNDPAIIRRNRRMVSINGAIAVDLTRPGHGRHRRAAPVLRRRRPRAVRHRRARQRGGQEHHLPALDGDGRRRAGVDASSPALPAGTPVTTPRHHVQYVVTEHGIANLGMLTARERRAALIAIAHPDFRGELQRRMKD